MRDRFTIFITYSQVTVYDGSVEAPFNDWTPAHVKQGFAWRPGSVSFRTLTEAEEADVEVDVVGQLQARPDSIRAIRVPFVVSTETCVASITETRAVKIPRGTYALLCEMGRTAEGRMWIRLTMAQEKEPKAAVVKADEELIPEQPLLLDAQPA